MKDDIRAIVNTSVLAIYETLPEAPPLTLSNDLELFGKQGIFDSLALVTLIVEIEEKLQTKLSIDLLLANEKAFSQQHSPFSSIERLVDYIFANVDQEKDSGK
ncbi:MAG: acyl carrier protein [Pseudomonadota bacterium]